MDQAGVCPALQRSFGGDAPMDRNNRTARQHGFTIVQMIVALAIISIVSTVAVLGVKSSREHFKMQSSARLFASYCEKARADSVRRHAASGEEASVEMFGEGTTTYNVTMDYGSGIVETRTFQLDPGIQFSTKAKKVTFDWRGRLLGQAEVFQIESTYLKDSIPVDVSGSGDVTIWSQYFPDQLIPDVTISNAPDDVDHSTPSPSPSAQASPSATASPSPSDGASPTPTPSPGASPSPTATPHGNGNNDGNNGNGNNGNNASPTPTATPSASVSPIPQCVMTISPSTLSLSQSVDAHKIGTATVTMTSATGVRVLSAAQAGNGNSLILGLSLSRIDGNGSSIITVTTKNGAGNRGDFTVNVTADPACGTGAKLTVSVSN